MYLTGRTLFPGVHADGASREMGSARVPAVATSMSVSRGKQDASKSAMIWLPVLHVAAGLVMSFFLMGNNAKTLMNAT